MIVLLISGENRSIL